MSEQRIVVVTGGGSGMGRAIALRFAEAGDRVYIIGRRVDQLEKVAAESPNIEGVAGDVTDVEAVNEAVNKIVQKHKTINVLVNCAGGNTKVSDDVDLAGANRAWKSIIDVNLTGTFNVIFAFLPHLVRPGGRVVNITSLAAFSGSSNPGVSGQAYSAAKAGVHGMSRTLVSSLAPEGITINCVAPGIIDHTGFFGPQGMADERRRVNIARTPAGRLGEPNDIAAGVFYIASDEASFVNGEVLNINGGIVFGR